MDINIKLDGVELSGEELRKEKEDLLKIIGNIYELIEEEFGPIDKLYTLKEINFNSGNTICTSVNEKLKTILINIPKYTMLEGNKNNFQRLLNLSHELIHTITPCGDNNTPTYLDEGLAVVFSERYTNCACGCPGNYCIARDLVKDLLKLDRDIIKKLRNKYPYKKISDYSIENIAEELQGDNTELISKLIKSFY